MQKEERSKEECTIEKLHERATEEEQDGLEPSLDTSLSKGSACHQTCAYSLFFLWCHMHKNRNAVALKAAIVAPGG